MSEQNTTVAPKSTLQQLITSDWMKQQLAMALPKICTADRFMRVALTALNKTPKLLDCTKQSVLSCLIKCAELGLEPDGRRAHLIPFGQECTVIIDFKGKVELAMRSGTVANIHADKICENDVFEYNKGEVVSHKIDFRKERGRVYAYYSIVRMKDGGEKAEVMTLAEVEAIRNRSKAWISYQKGFSKDCPWATDPDEMGKKTVFHRASKWITLSPELRTAEDLEDEHVTPVPIALNVPETVTITDAPKADASGLAAAANVQAEPVDEDISKSIILKMKESAAKKGVADKKEIDMIIDAYCSDDCGKDFNDLTAEEYKALLAKISKHQGDKKLAQEQKK